jgi:hypothetical protein
VELACRRIGPAQGSYDTTSPSPCSTSPTFFSTFPSTLLSPNSPPAARYLSCWNLRRQACRCRFLPYHLIAASGQPHLPAMATTNVPVTLDTPIVVKILFRGQTKKYKLPLKDLGAHVLPEKVGGRP